MIRNIYYKVEYSDSYNYNSRRPYCLYHGASLEKAIEFIKDPHQDRFKPFDPNRIQLVKYTEEIVNIE